MLFPSRHISRGLSCDGLRPKSISGLCSLWWIQDGSWTLSWIFDVWWPLVDSWELQRVSEQQNRETVARKWGFFRYLVWEGYRSCSRDMGGPSGFSAVKHSDVLGAEMVAVCARSQHSLDVSDDRLVFIHSSWAELNLGINRSFVRRFLTWLGSSREWIGFLCQR